MEFLIIGQNPQTGEQDRFNYNNLTNRLTRESDGYTFRMRQEGEDLNQADCGDGECPTCLSASQFPIKGLGPFGNGIPLKKVAEVSILKIQLGLSCNYSCDYCSQRFVERPKETSKKDIEEFMAKLENLSFDEERGLKIELWGGEPLVYWKTIKPLVAALKARFASWKNPPKFSMITNGSILTEEICYWLIKNDFDVAISHDGPGQHTRGPDPFDDPEQKEVILDFYRTMKKRNKISFNSMLTAQNMSRLEIQKWFRALTGDDYVPQGEGSIVDAYDDGGLANVLQTKAQHFQFRKTAFNDIYSTNGQIGFDGIVQKVQSFIMDLLNHKTTEGMGQKCGMDREDVIAVDLRGNVITCQNVSQVQTAPNGTSHKGGNLEELSSIELHAATHWTNRPHCSACPVLTLCKGSCMYLEGENWFKSCDSAYSDNVALFALAFERVTGGFVPALITPKEGTLPPERADIWGTIYEHKEVPKRKAFPIKVVSEKAEVVNGVEVYTQSKLVEGANG